MHGHHVRTHGLLIGHEFGQYSRHLIDLELSCGGIHLRNQVVELVLIGLHAGHHRLAVRHHCRPVVGRRFLLGLRWKRGDHREAGDTSDAEK